MSRRRSYSRDRPRGRRGAKNDVKAGIAALLCCILAVGAGSSLFDMSFDWFSETPGVTVPGDESINNQPVSPLPEGDVTEGVISAVAYEKGNGKYKDNSMSFTEYILKNTTYGNGSTAIFDSSVNRELYQVNTYSTINGLSDTDKSWINVLSEDGDNVIDVGKADRDYGVDCYKNYLYAKSLRARGEYYVFETDFRLVECTGILNDDVSKEDENVVVSSELASYFKIKLLSDDAYYSDYFTLYGISSPECDKVYLSLDEYEYEGNLLCGFDKSSWANIRIEYTPGGAVGIYVNGEQVHELEAPYEAEDAQLHSVCIAAERVAQRMRYQIDNVYVSAVGEYEDNSVGDTPDLDLSDDDWY